jgi:glycine hydroxymethyltransferase
MGLDLPSGGHLTHGFKTATTNVSASSKYFNSKPYYINSSGYIDYERLEFDVKIFKPRLIMIGYSAYSRDLDYERFRQIANINKSYLVCDMSHYNGFVSTGLFISPFKYCDIVTTTTHKTLGGPRAGMIFFKKKYEKAINNSVFPSMQGGPHENTICAIAHQLKFVMSPQYKDYMLLVRDNARMLAKSLLKYGYNIMTNGTDNHIILIDLRETGISGSKFERICDYVNISINKNSVFGDKSALSPGGIRIGTSAITTRGMIPENMDRIGNYIHELILISKLIISSIYKSYYDNDTTKKISLKEFQDSFNSYNQLSIIRQDVFDFSNTFQFYNKQIYI